MEFHYFHLSPSVVFFTILVLYLHILYQCVGEEISYFLVYHMSKYLVYQERYRQLSGYYPKSHCDPLTLSLNGIECTRLCCQEYPMQFFDQTGRWAKWHTNGEIKSNIIARTKHDIGRYLLL